MIAIDLQKSLDTASGKILLDIQLHIPEGKFITLYGPSGAGKTSILRMIAGLLKPDQGSVIVQDEYWVNTSTNIYIPPQKRNIGYVFQEYALFPNMTVYKNLEFAIGKNKHTQRLNELVEIMDLGDLQNRFPNDLSGGQQQRVALARALMRQPQLLLLDESLSALDPAMRKILQEYILKVHREFKCTTIMVSHDDQEIVKMSDIVYFLNQGKMLKSGDPKEILASKQPAGILKLKGEIISSSLKEGIRQLEVMVGTNVVKVQIPVTKMPRVAVGDSVFIFPENQGIGIENV